MHQIVQKTTKTYKNHKKRKKNKYFQSSRIKYIICNLWKLHEKNGVGVVDFYGGVCEWGLFANVRHLGAVITYVANSEGLRSTLFSALAAISFSSKSS